MLKLIWCGTTVREPNNALTLDSKIFIPVKVHSLKKNLFLEASVS
jgi:hypothetical protein